MKTLTDETKQKMSFKMKQRWASGQMDKIIRKTHIVLTCKTCGIEIKVKPSLAKTKKFCSKKCAAIYYKTAYLGKKRNLTEEQRLQLSERLSRRWADKKRPDSTCVDCGIKISHNRLRCNPCNGKYRTRENHPNWLGEKKCIDCGVVISRDAIRCRPCTNKYYIGVTHFNYIPKDLHQPAPRHHIHGWVEYKQWMQQILKKYNFLCQKCKSKGNGLRVHHIFNFKDNPDRILDIDNGIVLCEEHHKEFHHFYGLRKTNMEQLEYYLQNNHIQAIGG